MRREGGGLDGETFEVEEPLLFRVLFETLFPVCAEDSILRPLAAVDVTLGIVVPQGLLLGDIGIVPGEPDAFVHGKVDAGFGVPLWGCEACCPGWQLSGGRRGGGRRGRDERQVEEGGGRGGEGAEEGAMSALVGADAVGQGSVRGEEVVNVGERLGCARHERRRRVASLSHWSRDSNDTLQARSLKLFFFFFLSLFSLFSLMSLNVDLTLDFSSSSPTDTDLFDLTDARSFLRVRTTLRKPSYTVSAIFDFARNDPRTWLGEYHHFCRATLVLPVPSSATPPGLGTVKYATWETECAVEAYLRKSKFSRSNARTFIASDNQEYKWSGNPSYQHTWTVRVSPVLRAAHAHPTPLLQCLSPSGYVVASYDDRNPNEPSYPNLSGNILNISRTFTHLTVGEVAPLVSLTFPPSHAFRNCNDSYSNALYRTTRVKAVHSLMA